MVDTPDNHQAWNEISEMREHDEPQRSGRAWLGAAFARTSLPRNGLADYLELDYASVSRILTGHRLLDPNELALARGYFSIIPEGLPPDVLDAVGSLRSAKVRKFAASELLRFFSARMRDPQAESFARLIEERTGEQTLRSDQIVAICRVGGLDLRSLTAGYGVGHYPWPEPGRTSEKDDAAGAIARAASAWAKRDNLHAYEFDRGRRSRAVGARKKPRTRAVRVASVAKPAREFGRSDGFAVLESEKLPLIPAREVYLAPPGTEIRNGDEVAVLRPSESEALFGKLSLSTPTRIVIELADGNLYEVPGAQGAELRRIAFCRA